MDKKALITSFESLGLLSFHCNCRLYTAMDGHDVYALIIAYKILTFCHFFLRQLGTRVWGLIMHIV